MAVRVLMMVLLIGGPDESAALRQARTIWGPLARVERVRTSPGFFGLFAKYSYQVGCNMWFRPGPPVFHPVAMSAVSWDDAFTHVDYARNGRRDWGPGLQLYVCTDPAGYGFTTP